MHRCSSPNFGFSHHNYIGSLRQDNEWRSTWYEFFAMNRIEPQLKISYDNGLITNKIKIKITEVLTKLQSVLPEEIPSLVHGDLWGGNYIMSNNGPFLIDPAVYCGNREVDLAMTTLFGGFPGDFYRGYQDEFPLEYGWEDRLKIWNLYPLFVHLNLFGTGYLPQIEHILKKYS